MSDEKIIFEAWLELAQGYREVVIAAFVLPILFLRQIIGVEEENRGQALYLTYHLQEIGVRPYI